jgi:hypothetical protein
MRISRYEPFAANKVCAFSYVNEKDLPGKQKLLCCTKCKETFYKDRKCQRKHWKYHKLTCCAIEKDDPRIHQQFDELEPCLAMITNEYTNVGVSGRLLLHLFRQLKKILEDRDGDTPWSQRDISLIQEVANIMEDLVDDKDIWAAPNFANYFLSEDVLLTNRMKQAKILQQAAISEAPNGIGVYFGTFVVAMLRHACSDPPNANGTAGGIKTGPLAAAAIRRLMSSWNCKYARASTPLLHPLELGGGRGQVGGGMKVSLQHLYLYTFSGCNKERNKVQKWTKRNELVPGMTLFSFLRLMMEEKVFFPAIPLYQPAAMADLLNFQRDIVDRPYSHPSKKLKPAERLDLLNLYHDWCAFPTNVKPDASSYKPIEEGVLLMITGRKSKFLIGMYEALLDQNDNSPHDKRTTKLVKMKRRRLLNQVRPSVLAFLNCMEKEYRREMKLVSAEAQSFPEDIIPIIATYALPEDCGFILS